MQKDASKKNAFSEEQMKQVLGSPEGKQLLALLSRVGGKELRQAADAFKKGDYAAAQKALEPIVGTPEAASLLNKLNRK